MRCWGGQRFSRWVFEGIHTFRLEAQQSKLRKGFEPPSHTFHTSRLEAEQSKLRKGFEARLATQQQLLLAAKNTDVSNLMQKHAREQVRG